MGDIIVFDANSTDGTREAADQCADSVLTDDGKGLGNARNIGITQTSEHLILNILTRNFHQKPSSLARDLLRIAWTQFLRTWGCQHQQISLV